MVSCIAIFLLGIVLNMLWVSDPKKKDVGKGLVALSAFMLAMTADVGTIAGRAFAILGFVLSIVGLFVNVKTGDETKSKDWGSQILLLGMFLSALGSGLIIGELTVWDEIMNAVDGDEALEEVGAPAQYPDSNGEDPHYFEGNLPEAAPPTAAQPTPRTLVQRGANFARQRVETFKQSVTGDVRTMLGGGGGAAATPVAPQTPNGPAQAAAPGQVVIVNNPQPVAPTVPAPAGQKPTEPNWLNTFQPNLLQQTYPTEDVLPVLPETAAAVPPQVAYPVPKHPTPVIPENSNGEAAAAAPDPALTVKQAMAMFGKK